MYQIDDELTDESALVRELRDLALSANGGEFEISRGGVRILIQHSTGSSSSLLLRTSYDAVARATAAPSEPAGYREGPRPNRAIRPLRIELRAENTDDVAAKLKRTNLEYQTGDAKFDAAVYVDSPTTDEHVLRAVLCERTRLAAMDLLGQGFSVIEIDNNAGFITAQMHTFVSRNKSEARALAIIDAFVELVAELPPVTAAIGEDRPVPVAVSLTYATLLALVVFLVDCFLFNEVAEVTGGPGSRTLLIALCGSLVAGATAALLARTAGVGKLSGRSNSADLIAWLALVSFLLAAGVAFLVVSALGVALLERRR